MSVRPPSAVTTTTTVTAPRSVLVLRPSLLGRADIQKDVEGWANSSWLMPEEQTALKTWRKEYDRLETEEEAHVHLTRLSRLMASISERDPRLEGCYTRCVERVEEGLRPGETLEAWFENFDQFLEEAKQVKAAYQKRYAALDAQETTVTDHMEETHNRLQQDIQDGYELLNNRVAHLETTGNQMIVAVNTVSAKLDEQQRLIEETNALLRKEQELRDEL